MKGARALWDFRWAGISWSVFASPECWQGSQAISGPCNLVSSIRRIWDGAKSGRVLMVVILGGTGTLFGPALGAFVFVLLEDLLSNLTEHWLLLMGAFVVAVVLLLPNGIAGLLLRMAGKTSAIGVRATASIDKPRVVETAARHGPDSGNSKSHQTI